MKKILIILLFFTIGIAQTVNIDTKTSYSQNPATGTLSALEFNQLTTAWSQITNTIEIDSNHTLDTGVAYVMVNTTSANCTLSLPQLSSVALSTQPIYVTNTGANVVRIEVFAGDSIQNGVFFNLNTDETVPLKKGHSKWRIL